LMVKSLTQVLNEMKDLLKLHKNHEVCDDSA
jgi:hypothetical protein